MTDDQIFACWQRHDAKRAGRRGPEADQRNAVDDAAEELSVPYSRVRDVVLARMTMRFGG